MATKTLVRMMIFGGFALQAVSWVFFGAPIGRPAGPEYSQPRVQFVGLFFIIGVMLVFIAAIVYEVRGGKEDRGS